MRGARERSLGARQTFDGCIRKRRAVWSRPPSHCDVLVKESPSRKGSNRVVNTLPYTVEVRRPAWPTLRHALAYVGSKQRQKVAAPPCARFALRADRQVLALACQKCY
jgi:hypothetical protein